MAKKKHKKKKTHEPPVLATNKKAFFNYHVLEKHVCGIVLEGAEVKAVRMRNVSLPESYCFFKNEELWVRQMHIGNYTPAGYQNEDPTRTRKLLLQKNIIRRLQKKKLEQPLTIVPLRVFLSKKSWIKVEIALVSGKKLHDKRAAIKNRDQKRRADY
ncbi:MAG: SsrA-binding protein [Cytophagales bacterium]